MNKVCSCVNDKLNKYNLALKELSNAIKKIGGTGTIHGSIVDIDFYNHVYLDPYGNIIPYFSPYFGCQITYNDIPTLLKNECPEMYRQYLSYKKQDRTPIKIISTNDIQSLINYDTYQYKFSNLMKSLQYITDKNIIRIWDEDLFNRLESETYITNNNLQIE